MYLGVNIDHIATIREARKTIEPEPIYAALLVQEAGADAITTHLREDRRHINDEDVRLIKKIIKINFNLEMSLNDEIIKIAMNLKPDQATIVPEKRQEITTEGGLDVIKHFNKVQQTINILKNEGIKVSLFIDPEKDQIDAAQTTGADAIELHTGEYANAKNKKPSLNNIIKVSKYADDLSLEVHAGHGLTYQNVKPIASIKEIKELNIGHSIISRSVFIGIKQAVKEMIDIIEKARWISE